ncbi:TIGR02710 family CRISPR-associated CARF protein [bacterium]|nr:TIGR02710 family CRISPR-associated CARF protein [bacterium]
MAKILIITVGGSAEPILEFLEAYRQEAVLIYFICTGGPGKVSTSNLVDGDGDVFPAPEKSNSCGIQIGKISNSRKNIIQRSGYKGDYTKVILDNPDDFEEVHLKISSTIREAKESGYKIISDFTGGTKTMSAVLAMLSVLDFDINLSLTTGQRKDTEKVKGFSFSRIINLDSARVNQVFQQADILTQKYLYYSAEELFSRLLRFGLQQNILTQVEEKYNKCIALSLWDRFDYTGAFKILSDNPDLFPEGFKYLLKIFDKSNCSSYEKVFDLFCNAERQAYNGYYDNAVARVYRALELFAQIRLEKKYSIKTSCLEKSIDKVIDKEKWESKRREDGKIQIGLIDSYELLLELLDPVGNAYKDYKGELFNILNLRNNSKLAHGDNPVNSEQWDEFSDFFRSFIGECCKNIGVTPEYFQLPKTI